MTQKFWSLLLPFLLLTFSLYGEEEQAPDFQQVQGEVDLLEQLLQQVDILPSIEEEADEVLLADAGDSSLTISLPGGGEVISSDELAGGTDEEEPEGYLINFNDLNIVEVIRFVSRISGKNFIFDQTELDFTVTIVSEEPTSIENIMAALLQVLKINNLQLIEQGNNFLIHRNPNVNRPSKIVSDDDDRRGGAGGDRDETTLVTRVFRLERVPARSLSVIVRSMTSADALVETLEETNHLVITDLAPNVTRVASFIRSIDGPGGQLDVGQYVSRNTHMTPLADLAMSILEPIAQNDPIQLIPHPPSQSIFVISTPYMVERAMSILQMLDLTDSESRILSLKDLIYDPEMTNELNTAELNGRRWSEALASDDINNTRIEFYKLQYRSASTVQTALSQVGESVTSGSVFNQDVLQAIDSIQAIEESNMLVFTGTTEAIGVIKGFISRIDAPLRQVFIEMLILDTTIDKSLEFGVEWGGRYDGGANGAGSYGFLGPGSAIPAGLDTLRSGSAAADASGLTNNSAFTVGALGKVLTHNGNAFTSLTGLIRSIQTDSDVNVVMNPKLIAEDNTPAEVFVGINTRFQTESVSNESGDLITTNFEFRDVGSRLTVTPLLGDSDIVTLEIEQELSQGLGDVETTASTTGEEIGPVTKQVRTTTRVHIPDKQFLVMSGMISETRTRAKSSVPCLGGVPVAGAAFSRNTTRGEKRNLMIFIRPKIIDTEREIAEVTKNQRTLFENKSRPKKKWNFEIDAGLDILNLKQPNLLDKDWGP